MEIAAPIIAALFGLAFVVLVIWIIGFIFYGVFIAPIVLQFNLYKGVTEGQKSILLQKFPYYIQLSSKYKIEFEKRLKYFLIHKEFIPKGMSSITEEMRILVGACAVQLTFGYKPLKLSFFPKIILYPAPYYSRHTKRTHKGEVNTNGIIVLSWEDFLKGYNLPHDGFNVGLHEMAHALKIEDTIQNDEFAFIEDKDLHDWHKISTEEYNRIRKGEKSFIRSYGGSNRDEFFAVSVEQFFEQPLEFKKALPELYYSLCCLLNQDPATFIEEKNPS